MPLRMELNEKQNLSYQINKLNHQEHIYLHVEKNYIKYNNVSHIGYYYQTIIITKCNDPIPTPIMSKSISCMGQLLNES